MRKLDQRERERDQLALEEIFNNLKQHMNPADEDNIETISMQSMKEIKEDKQINIYKPSLKSLGQKAHQSLQSKQIQEKVDYVVNEYPSPMITSAKALKKE